MYPALDSFLEMRGRIDPAGVLRSDLARRLGAPRGGHMSRRAGAAGRRVVVLGGTSEIALAIVRELQRSAPREVALVGRDPEGLAAAAEGLRAGWLPAGRSRSSSMHCRRRRTSMGCSARSPSWEGPSW